MAEIEIGVLSGQCLKRRIPDRETLAHETKAWEDRRNREHAMINWRFTLQDARTRLNHRYPEHS